MGCQVVSPDAPAGAVKCKLTIVDGRKYRAALAVVIALCAVFLGGRAGAQGYLTPTSNPDDFVAGPGGGEASAIPGTSMQPQGVRGRENPPPLQNFDLFPEGEDEFKREYQSGSLTEDQFQELCARIAAKRLTERDVQTLGDSMGFAADETERLRQCAQEAAAPPNTPRGQAQRAQAEENRREIARQFELERRRQRLKASPIEQEFRALASPLRVPEAPTPEHLEQFGYSVFAEPVSTFAPATNVPVSDDYILGPGDGLTVLLWGRVNETLRLPVQRDGTVLMPRIGPIQVAGLNFGQAKKLVESRVGQIEGVQVNVTMGAIRTIQVFVMGKVNQPGLYTISALSHVSNALVAAGGISKVGTLRNVELRRGNRAVRVIDLYDILLHGDSSSDVRLEPRDVVFVPVIGPVVGLTGDVKSPGIYELRGESDLRSVLNLAGGVSAFGYAQRIQVERIDNHQRRIALDVDLGALGRSRFVVRDGDLVKVFPVLPQQQNVVVLKGNVNRPGTYQWREGMKVSDLIREGEGVSDHTYLDYATIRRRVGPTQRVEFLPVHLGAAMRGDSSTADLPLVPRDELTVYSENDLNDVPTVTIRGAVRKPGVYPLSQGMRLSDLIYEAGGLKDDAYQRRGTLARTEIVDGATTRHSYIEVDIAAALKPGSAANPELARYDELFVEEASNWHKPWQVTVRGQVMRPGPYVIHEGERLSELLHDCGGLRSDAYLPAIVFERQSVKQMQQAQLDESRARLKRNLTGVALMPQQTGERESDRAAAIAMVQKVLQESEGQSAVGRVALNIASLDSLPGSSSDLILQNDDKIVVPRKPSSVSVLGQVYNQAALVYDPDLRVKDYLQRAGGAAETGDLDHLFVIRANGAIMTDQSYRDMRRSQIFPVLPLVSGGLMDAYLQPGDTVFVPEKLIYVTGLQYTKDVTTIVANAAQGLAIIGILATQI
jgi:protein involved in polysaccharide export with SLBB domain